MAEIRREAQISTCQELVLFPRHFCKLASHLLKIRSLFGSYCLRIIYECLPTVDFLNPLLIAV